MDIDILPHRFSNAKYVQSRIAVEGTTDVRGIGTLTTMDEILVDRFQCQWEPFVTSTGLIIIYYEFPTNDSFLVQAIEDFYEKIKVI